MAKIAPSLLSADFSRLGEELDKVVRAGAEYIHVDVMDGRFVPQITIGQPVVRALKRICPVPLDVHLMIERPDDAVESFLKAGSDYLTVHVETALHLDRTLNLIKQAGAGAGAALNPSTPVSLLENVIHLTDLILIMSVNPGFGGQKFIPYSLDKIRELSEMAESRGVNPIIAVDGGINRDNIVSVAEAGADLIIAGSSIFHSDDPGEMTRRFIRMIEKNE